MILLDSSFLVAIEVEKDENHQKAKKIMDEIINGNFGETLISDYIFDETVTVTFLKTKDLKKAVFVGENLRFSAKIIKIDSNLFNNAWKIFKEQKNTKFSFTDCTSISLLKNRKIKNIATFDKDFKVIEWVNIIS